MNDPPLACATAARCIVRLMGLPGLARRLNVRAAQIGQRRVASMMVVGVLVVTACSGSTETALTDPAPSTAAPTTPSIATTTTTIPVVSPTDNGGLLYRVESAPWFGGFELHLSWTGDKFGFVDTPEDAETAPERLLRLILWSFANQHSQFVLADGAVDVAGYVTFLESNDWVDDEVYVPVRVRSDTESVTRSLTLPPEGEGGVQPSSALTLDFKRPFIISNDDLANLEGFDLADPNFLFTSPCCRTDFGVTGNGQLYFAIHIIPSQAGPPGPLDMVPLGSTGGYVISERLGQFLEVTSRITYPEPSPQEQWFNPYSYYIDPFLINPQNLIPPYPILDYLEFNKLFAPVTPSGESDPQEAGPPLPPAGDQPDDPQAAEAEIRANFALLFDRDVPVADRDERFLDDTEGIQEARDQLSDVVVEAARTAVRTLTKVVFVSPTEAWFKYDLTTVVADIPGRFGIAYLIDGQWKIARAVVCQDLALAGSPCDPPVNEITPPSSG